MKSKSGSGRILDLDLYCVCNEKTKTIAKI
jgi:hypothetical protein